MEKANDIVYSWENYLNFFFYILHGTIAAGGSAVFVRLNNFLKTYAENRKCTYWNDKNGSWVNKSLELEAGSYTYVVFFTTLTNLNTMTHKAELKIIQQTKMDT